MTCEYASENSILLSCEIPVYRHCICKVLFRYVFCSKHHNRFYLKRLFHKPCNGMVFLPYVFCNVCLDCHSRWLFYGKFGIRKTLSRCLMLFVLWSIRNFVYFCKREACWVLVLEFIFGLCDIAPWCIAALRFVLFCRLLDWVKSFWLCLTALKVAKVLRVITSSAVLSVWKL